MSFEQSIVLAQASRIGGTGLPDTALDAAFVAVDNGLERLRTEDASGALPLIGIAAKQDDIADIKAAADKLRDGASDIVVLGTGGSSLGAQALAQLRNYLVPCVGRFAEPRIHFFDNLDPITFGQALAALPLATTRFLVVSKSGGTGETLTQTIAVLTALEQAGLRDRVHELVIGLSEPEKASGSNALRALLGPENVTFFDHHTGIGGRYSVLSNVGLLPAAAIGVDIAAVRAGAAEVVNGLRGGGSSREIPAAVGAAVNVAAALEGKGIAVLMPYADRLERFIKWWVQLWAESLGKNGKGSQPVGALGPVDQHSQQQLYLDGPDDKLFTIISLDLRETGPTIDAELAARAGQSGFAGKRIGDLVAAQSLAMADTFARRGRPVRQIRLNRLDEHTLGGLLMHFMLETILTGYALGVDPFDQPAVEEAKVLARQYLAEGRG